MKLFNPKFRLPSFILTFCLILVFIPACISLTESDPTPIPPPPTLESIIVPTAIVDSSGGAEISPTPMDVAPTLEVLEEATVSPTPTQPPEPTAEPVSIPPLAAN